MSLVHGRDRRRVLQTVIVFLEMERPPPRPPRPQPRRDLAIRRLERPAPARYLGLYRAVGGAHDWTDRLLWPPQRLAATIHDAAVEIHLLEAGGVPAGFAELDFRRRPVAELALFGLLPAFVGQGLGGYFLDWALASLWRQGIAKVLVDTNDRDHPRALALYRRAGFREVARARSWLVPSACFPPLAENGPPCHSAPLAGEEDEA